MNEPHLTAFADAGGLVALWCWGSTVEISLQVGGQRFNRKLMLPAAAVSAVCDDGPVVGCMDGSIHWINTQQGTSDRAPWRDIPISPVNYLAVSPDRSTVAAVFENQQIAILRSDGSHVLLTHSLNEYVGHLNFSPDNRMLFICDERNTRIYFFSVSDGNLLGKLAKPHLSPSTTSRISHYVGSRVLYEDNEHLIVAAVQNWGELSVWNLSPQVLQDSRQQPILPTSSFRARSRGTIVTHFDAFCIPNSLNQVLAFGWEEIVLNADSSRCIRTGRGPLSFMSCRIDTSSSMGLLVETGTAELDAFETLHTLDLVKFLPDSELLVGSRGTPIDKDRKAISNAPLVAYQPALRLFALPQANSTTFVFVRAL